MKKEKFTIPVYYLPYILNGDMDGLTDEEIKDLQLFEQDCVYYYGIGHFATENENTYFSRINDINRFGAECQDVYYMHKL